MSYWNWNINNYRRFLAAYIIYVALVVKILECIIKIWIRELNLTKKVICNSFVLGNTGTICISANGEFVQQCNEDKRHKWI